METALIVASITPEIMVAMAALVVLAATIVLLITAAPTAPGADEEAT